MLVKKNTINSIIDEKGIKLQNPSDIAKCLNTHFSSVGKNMASKFDDLVTKDPIAHIKRVTNS